MFSLSRKASHDLSEMLKFIVVQSPLAALDGELSNALVGARLKCHSACKVEMALPGGRNIVCKTACQPNAG
jgi:hypothetical protein